MTIDEWEENEDIVAHESLYNAIYPSFSNSNFTMRRAKTLSQILVEDDNCYTVLDYAEGRHNTTNRLSYKNRGYLTSIHNLVDNEINLFHFISHRINSLSYQFGKRTIEMDTLKFLKESILGEDTYMNNRNPVFRGILKLLR